MARKTELDKAIEQVDHEIKQLQDVRARLTQQKVATPKRTRKAKPEMVYADASR